MSVGFTAAMLTVTGRLLLLVPEALVHPSALTIDHDWAWITPTVAWSGAAVWGLVACVSAWRCPMVALAVAWTLIALLPRLLLPMPDGIHERHLYLPLLGAWVACGAALSQRKAADDPAL